MRKKRKHAVVKKRRARLKKGESSHRTPPGFERHGATALLVPTGRSVVSPDAMRRGLAGMRARTRDLLDELVGEIEDAYDLVEVELQASFSADGKFLGFGVGGAATVSIRVRPKRS